MRNLRVYLRKSDELGGRGQTPPIYTNLQKHTAGVEQAKYRRRAYGTHIKSVTEFSESWGAEIVKVGARYINS
jgi:hypothetical protein